MSNLKNKVAIVTGGGRDIGRECSIKLAREGASVCINYYASPALAEETKSIIEDFGGKVIVVQGDVTKQDEINNIVARCRKAFGEEIHILVNVAGGLVGRKTLSELDPDFWNSVITLNLTSVYLVTKAVVPFMPGGSSIINFASQAGRDGGGPGASAYAAAKGGILSFTRSIAKELGPNNIRVNAVSPGMINTTFHDTFTKPEARVKVVSSTPLRREGEAREVADLVGYLASTEASFITGASIEINGGLYFI